MANHKNIVLLTNIPTPYRTTFYNELASNLEKKGFGFRVLYCATTEPRRHWKFQPDDVSYQYDFLPGISLNLKQSSFHINISVVARLRLLKPSLLILAGSWNMPTNLLALATAKQMGIPILFWSEGHVDALRYRKGPVPWMRRNILRRFSGFIVPNNRSGAFNRQEMGNPDIPLILVPNTVDSAQFRRPQDGGRTAAREKLNLPRETKIFLNVSYLEARKGVIELASAYRDLPEQVRQQSMLVFLGTGSLEKDIRAIADDLDGGGKIILPGHVDASQVPLWLHAADGFVLNTFIDPNPLTPIEASFASLPILLSQRAGNAKELIPDGKQGVLIDDPGSPSDALKKFLSLSRGELAEMGAKARSNVEANFSLENAARNAADELVRFQASFTQK